MPEKNRSRSYTVAFCALMAALGAAIMLAGGLIPIATYCAPMLSAVLLIPVMQEFSRREAWMTWAVTTALSLILSADKEAAFLYLFIGYYPILRELLDRLPSRVLRLLCKLLFFALSLGAAYGLMIFLFQLDAVTEEFRSATRIANAVFFAALVAVMLLYDVALDRVSAVYRYKLRPKLKFLSK